MANKSKNVRVKQDKSNSKNVRRSTIMSLRETAQQNFMAERSRKFRGIDIVVKANRDILDNGFCLEVDLDGQPTEDSHRALQRQAQVLMSSNFRSKEEATADIGWGSATWSTSDTAQAAQLDPSNEFEVGVTITRKPNRARAVKMLKLIRSGVKIDGISLKPNDLYWIILNG